MVAVWEDGTIEWGQLLKRSDDISQKMLNQVVQLRERNSLVQRVICAVMPRRRIGACVGGTDIGRNNAF